MEIEEKPRVTKAAKSKEYTEIQFKPDLSLFGYEQMDDDLISLLHRRVIDIAGVTDESVKVYWNGERVNIRDFDDYMKTYTVSEKVWWVVEGNWNDNPIWW